MTSQFQIPSRDRTCRYLVAQPASDVDRYISSNAVRLGLSVISLVLAASDILRSGLGTAAFSGWLTPYLPETAMYFGPFAFPMAQIRRTPLVSNSSSQEYFGSIKGVNITSTSLWSYKFDSISVPQRALAKQLNVSAYPPCVLYKEPCASSRLSLETTFKMTDQLISSIQQTYFSTLQVGRTSLPIGFRTISFWVDRLHHYLMHLAGHKRSESRLHAVHHYRVAKDQTLDLCDRKTPRAHQPFVCGDTINWTCQALTGDGMNVSIARHVMLRLNLLQRQYPHWEFDVTFYASQIELSNRNQLLPIPTSSLLIKKNLITTIIRGRTCTASSLDAQDTTCTTLLTDDYRYQRESVTTDVTGWFHVTSFVRATCQNYVWTRILLLWLGCYRAQYREAKFRHSTITRRIRCAWATFFKIPSFILVYSSWMPAIGYAFAYLIDCDIDHLHLDNLFASSNGIYTFQFWNFIRAASVQMRNIWFIALFIKCITLVEIRWLAPPSAPWKLRHGLYGFHCQVIGWISALTIFAPLRLLAFRTTDVLFFEMVPSSAVINQFSISKLSENVTEFGYRLDLKTILQASVLTAFALLVTKLLDWIHYQRFGLQRHWTDCPSTSFVYCRTHYLPYSVGTIASFASVSVFWGINPETPGAKVSRRRKTIADTREWRQRNNILVGIATLEASIVQIARRNRYSIIESLNFQIPQPADCSACTGNGDLLTERGCPVHESIYQVEHRTKAMWSMVRLVNLALFTDPITLFRLYFVGLPLYLYSVHSDLNDRSTSDKDVVTLKMADDRTKPLFLLPCTMDQLVANSLHECCGTTQYELVGIVDSTDVPWTLLLHCG